MPFHKRQAPLFATAVIGLVWLMAGGGGWASAEDDSALVALVIDSSGSLRPADLERTRSLVRGLLERLPSGSQVALFSFDDQPRLLLARTRDADSVARALRGLRLGGRFTLLYDALYDAIRYLNEQPAARKVIVLLTDGKDENSALRLDDALKPAQQSSIPVFAIGMGVPEERLLRRVAKLTGGEYLAARSASGPALAARIAALPPVPSATPSVSLPTPPSTLPLPASTTPASVPARPRFPAWIPATSGVLILLAVVVMVLRTRARRTSWRCPDCGKDLPAPGAPCPAGHAAGAVAELPSRPASELSETVVERMDLTEEYLEKTVTLREDPVLAITAGPGAGLVVSLNRVSATSIGRAKANDIVLDDVSVSSQHCRIRPEGEAFVLHDLKSTNGTFVNEHRVSRHVLAEGDLVKLGETYLQFRTRQIKP